MDLEKVSRRDIVAYFFGFFALLIVLSPLLKSGLLCDDILNSRVKGLLAVDGVSFIDFVKSRSAVILTSGGRLSYVGFFFLYGFWDIFGDNVHVVKSVQYLLIITNVILFQRLITKISGSQLLGFVFLVLFSCFMQMRIYLDPILAFISFFPLQMFYILLALNCYWRYVRMRSLSSLFFTLIVYMLYLGTYELAFIIPILCIGISYLYNKKLDSRAFVYFLIISISYLIFIMIVRHHATVYGGIVIGRSIYSVIKTYYIQLTSVLPLSYGIGAYLRGQVVSFDPASYWIGLFASLLVFVALLQLSNSQAVVPKNKKIILFISLILWSFPCLLIGFSARYQEELIALGFGTGHGLVYVQIFGVCTLFAFCLYHVRYSLNLACRYRFLFNVGYYLGLIAISLVVGATYILNIGVVHVYNHMQSDEQKKIVGALDKGLLSQAEDNSILIREPYNPLEDNPIDGGRKKSSYFYFMHTGKLFDIYSMNDYVLSQQHHVLSSKSVTHLDLKKSNVYYLRKHESLLEPGHTLYTVAKLTDVYYKRHNNVADIQQLLFDKGTFVCSAKSSNACIVGDWVGGFSGKEYNQEASWRWCDKSGKLVITNPGKNPIKLRLNFVASTGYPAFSDLSISGELINKKVRVNDRGAAVSLTITVDPGMHEIVFNSTAKQMQVVGDERKLFFAIRNLEFIVIA